MVMAVRPTCGTEFPQYRQEFSPEPAVPNGQHSIQATIGPHKDSITQFTAQSQEIVFQVTSSAFSVRIRKTGERALTADEIQRPDSAAGRTPEQRPRPSPTAASGIEDALYNAAETLMGVLPENTTVAVLSISSRDRNMSEFVIEELTYILVDSGIFKIVDRKSLDTIRNEQNFQLSGDVDDSSAVGIGKLLGANIVITGSISGTDSLRRLRLKALDVQTAEILTMASERF
jgi:curli biogenesis system outer membrane secretion channel CsgG